MNKKLQEWLEYTLIYKKSLYKIDKICVYCGEKFSNKPGKNRTKDHVEPKSKNKFNDRFEKSQPNTVACCKQCNSKKGHIDLIIFLCKKQNIRLDKYKTKTETWTIEEKELYLENLKKSRGGIVTRPKNK